MDTVEETGQARDVALLGPTSDQPVRVDTAMKAAAGEYQGPGGRVWWDKVAALAAHA